MAKVILFIISLALISLFSTKPVSAHPGNTDIYGCHTCYTNCWYYGLSYWQYHCHTPKYSPICAPRVYCDRYGYYWIGDFPYYYCLHYNISSSWCY